MRAIEKEGKRRKAREGVRGPPAIVLRRLARGDNYVMQQKEHAAANYSHTSV